MEKKKSAPITTGDASKRIPKRLYKYTNMAFIESCILNGVYASRLDAVNDPFECDGIRYPQLYRICCMTNSPRQMLLWAYYTQHSECCVEFDVSEISSDLLRHVDYVTSFSAHKNMSLDQIYDSLYRKGKEWEHENEYRAVYYERDFDPSCWTIKNGNIFLKAPVKSVTFGLFSDKETSRYKGALEVLNKYGIEAKRCRLQNNKYALEDDCQFDLNLELENANRLLAINSGGMAEVILDLEAEIALKNYVEMFDDPSALVPLEKIVKNKKIYMGLDKLRNIKMLVLHYTEDGPSPYNYFYELTEKGMQYYRQHFDSR